MTAKIRTFIAITLPEEAAARLGVVQNQLKQQIKGRAVRWVAVPNLHITLHFLGGVEAGQVAPIQQAMRQAAMGVAPFSLRLVGVGCFPHTRRPRVIWAGVGGETAPLLELHQTVGEALSQAIGFAAETRPYNPHLTLGRVRKDARPPQVRHIGGVLEQASRKQGAIATVPVARLVLMRSDTQPTGPVYTPLAEAVLTG